MEGSYIGILLQISILTDV